VTETLKAHLYNEVQARAPFENAWRMAKALLSAGNRLVLELTPEPKTREQEKKYHAMIGDIARQVALIPGRQREKPEDAKRLLVSAFREDTKSDPDFVHEWAKFGHFQLAPGLRGELVALGLPTRKFSKPLAIAFITWLEVFGAEHQVQWSNESHIDAETGEILEAA